MTASYPAGNVVARAIKVLRDEGPGIFWIKLVAGLGFYRRLVLQERLLDHAVPDFAPVLPVRIELLKESEVDDYLALRPDATRALVVDRLRAGQLCFVARHEGRVVSSCWATARRAWTEFLACEIDLTAGDVYLFDAFTEAGIAVRVSRPRCASSSCDIFSSPTIGGRFAPRPSRTGRPCARMPKAVSGRRAHWSD
jgi:hypothetical protein